MEEAFDFTLPRGYIDKNGNLHRNGRMRLATGKDEISAISDPRVRNYPDYLTIVILSKVITHLEGVEMITPDILEKLFTADLAFLEDMYEKINAVEIPQISFRCPYCGKMFTAPPKFTQAI